MESSAIISWLFWAYFVLPLTFTHPVLGGNETDRLSLIAFKAKITHDPLKVFTFWNSSQHFCQWRGVTCGKKHQRVTRLDLNSLQLSGSLSPHIGNLSFLKVLDLQNNSFTGHIPLEIGRLFRLQRLLLQINSFNGEIPRNISGCLNLLYLSLGSNTLRGELPSELSSLSKIKALSLFNNSFVGEILPSLGNVSSLEIFDIAINSFHGNIPDSFGQLKRLNTLYLGANNLSGQFPPAIFNLSSIKYLSAPVNQLQGSLPPDLGHGFPELEILNLHTNQLHGPIPFSISNASKLSTFSIAKNQFNGVVPDLTKLHNLQIVSLDMNNLTNDGDMNMNFLCPLVNCSNLQRLGISDNNFGGIMPEYISNFSMKLEILTFGRNHIRGNIPREIGNLVNLQDIGMETNQLTGTIPNSIGKLNKLRVLFLNGNELSGIIPPSIGNLSTVEKLNLRLNNLEGSIPTSLANCQSLIWLYLSQNNLTGSIPREIFSISSLSYALDLSENHLTGLIPVEVGKLINLVNLNISNNKLSGEIPGSIGSCVSLTILSLRGNLFQGTIPQSLKSLRGVQTIDFSLNNLSGEIPKYLESFQFLEYLNLSFNNFEGELPMEGLFKNASKFSVTGNFKLCGGISELKLRSCSSNEPKQLSRKLKLIIIIAGGTVAAGLITMFSFVAIFCLRKRRSKATPISSLQPSGLQVSYYDLFTATDGFASSNLLGFGGFGSVYKGRIPGNDEILVVAVKVFNHQYRTCFKSFKAECEALRNTRHRNLVRSLTVCSSIDSQGNDFLALVYEFMENGSLEDWLYPTAQGTNVVGCLNLKQRLKIATEVANALEYLHNQCHITIVHCDLKPSNILLDGDMTAHVADFGLARLIHEQASSHQLSSEQTSSIGLKGSIGYAAPEYGMGSEVSTHGDMYSYGILLLEMFTGKRPTDAMFTDGLDIHNFALMGLSQGTITKIVDPNILERETESRNNDIELIHEILLSVLQIAIACSAQNPRARNEISSVVADLLLVNKKLLPKLGP